MENSNLKLVNQEIIEKLLRELYFYNPDFFINIKSAKKDFNEIFGILHIENFENILVNKILENFKIYYDILNIILENIINPVVAINVINDKVNINKIEFSKYEVDYLIVLDILNKFFNLTNLTSDEMIQKLFSNTNENDNGINLSTNNSHIASKTFVDSIFTIFNTIGKDYIDSLCLNINNKYKSCLCLNKFTKLFDDDSTLIRNIHFKFENTNLLNIFTKLINFIIDSLKINSGNKFYIESELYNLSNDDNFIKPVFEKINDFIFSYMLNVIYNLIDLIKIENCNKDIIKYN